MISKYGKTKVVDDAILPGTDQLATVHQEDFFEPPREVANPECARTGSFGEPPRRTYSQVFHARPERRPQPDFAQMHRSNADLNARAGTSTPCYRRWPEGMAVRQAVIGRMPAGAASRTAESRAIPALIELADSSLWAIRIPFDVVEADPAFTQLAAVLADREDIPSARDRLSEDISFALDFRVILASPALDLAASENFWKVRTSAIAAVLALSGSPEVDTGRLVAEKEAEAREAIVEGLALFSDNLNRDALALATRDGAFRPARYNLLTRAATEQQLRYRMQFAQTFPALLHWISGEAEGPTGAVLEIRKAIDNGAQLVPLLAKRYPGVAQSAVRYMVNKPPAQVGEDWQARIPMLLRLLSVIAPEKRPRNEGDWSAFSNACVMISELFGRPITTPLSLVFLRSVAHKNFTGIPELTQGAEPHQIVSIIEEFTAAIAVALRWELGRRKTETSAGEHTRKAEVAIEKYLLTHGPASLFRQAVRWRDEHNRIRAARIQAAETKRPTNAWAAVLASPMPFGDLRVVELESHAALEKESRQLDHCVHLYDDMCRSGLSRIYSVRDPNGRALSTAEIRPTSRQYGAVECRVHQHKGMHNGIPEARCIDAIQALVHLLGTEPHASRMTALYLTRERNGSGTGGLPGDIDTLFSTVESVRKVLELESRGRYERLVGEAAAKRV